MKQSFILLAACAALLTACSEPAAISSSSGAMSASSASSAEATQYTCPMHPHYISTDPNGSCPICGMDLVPVSANTSATPGDGAIAVAPEMIQTIGIRTALVDVTNFGRSLLYRVYSPDLIAAQKDYLASLSIGNENRIAAVRQRLRSIGMQNAAIERLTETRSLIERVPVYAESGGTVAELQVSEGDYIKPGTPILRLQSYAGVWIIARVPEQDLALIDTDLSFRARLARLPKGGSITSTPPSILERGPGKCGLKSTMQLDICALAPMQTSRWILAAKRACLLQPRRSFETAAAHM